MNTSIYTYIYTYIYIYVYIYIYTCIYIYIHIHVDHVFICTYVDHTHVHSICLNVDDIYGTAVFIYLDNLYLYVNRFFHADNLYVKIFCIYTHMKLMYIHIDICIYIYIYVSLYIYTYVCTYM